jgi:hypothetical protein
MSGNANDIRLGAAWVYFGTVAGNIGESVNLGYTKGGVTLMIETGSYEILVDQEGDTPVGETITGRRCVVMCPMAETNMERMSKIFPDSTWNAVTGIFEIASGVGDDLMDYSDELYIESKNNPDLWFKIYKAAPVASTQATFLPNAEMIWPVQFKGFICESTHTHAGKLMALHEPS